MHKNTLKFTIPVFVLLVFSVSLSSIVQASEDQNTVDITLNMNTNSTFEIYLNATVGETPFEIINGELSLESCENMTTTVTGFFEGALKDEYVQEIAENVSYIHLEIYTKSIANHTTFCMNLSQNYFEISLFLEATQSNESASQINGNMFILIHVSALDLEEQQNIIQFVQTFPMRWSSYKPMIIEYLEAMGITVNDVDAEAELSNDTTTATIEASFDLVIDVILLMQTIGATSEIPSPVPTPIPPIEHGPGEIPGLNITGQGYFGLLNFLRPINMTFENRIVVEYNNGSVSGSVHGKLNGIAGIPLLSPRETLDKEIKLTGPIITEITAILNKESDNNPLHIKIRLKGYMIGGERFARYLYQEFERIQREQNVTVSWSFGGDMKPAVSQGNITFTNKNTVSAVVVSEKTFKVEISRKDRFRLYLPYSALRELSGEAHNTGFLVVRPINKEKLNIVSDVKIIHAFEISGADIRNARVKIFIPRDIDLQKLRVYRVKENNWEVLTYHLVNTFGEGYLIEADVPSFSYLVVTEGEPLVTPTPTPTPTPMPEEESLNTGAIVGIVVGVVVIIGVAAYFLTKKR